MKNFILVLLAVCATALANAQPNCDASMTWVQNPGTLSVTFTNTSTASAPGGPVGVANTYRHISIGGTYFSTSPSYTHTFTGPGTYLIVARVNYVDSVSGAPPITCQDTTHYFVTVAQVPLTCSTLSATFTSSFSYPYYNFSPTVTNQNWLSYTLWNMGDGSPVQTTYNSGGTSHSYAAAGTYTVSAITYWTDSTNNLTCTDTAIQTLIYAPPPCAVSFTGTGTGTIRTFTATNLSGTPGITYSWNFGDGTTATGNPVTHTYAYGGNYTVSVSTAAPSPASCQGSTTQNFSVNGPMNCATAYNLISLSTYGTVATRTYWAYTNSMQNYPGYTVTHNWDFNNGATSTGQTVTYTHPANGLYNVRLITRWYASSAPTVIACADTSYQNVQVGIGGVNCATASNGFTAAGFSLTKSFTPIVTPANTNGITISNLWNFGDGTTATTTGPNNGIHTYAANGIYNVCLITRWLQAGTTNVLCADTTCQMITAAVPNIIYGSVYRDSTQNPGWDSLKVWLITYNPTTSMLTAVDSTVVYGWSYAQFQFNNKPAGVYRTKAAVKNPTVNAFGFVPTYRDSSLTWSGANTFTHNNGTTWSGGIYMRQGLMTSGPGFVGGSVLSGANKGAADGDPVVNQLVFLRDAATGSLVQSAYTNSAGQYSFSNIPLGNYTVYPEEMNYATTPSAPITLAANNASVSGILFKKDDVDMDIRQVMTSVRNISSNGAAFTLTPNPTSGKIILSIVEARAKSAAVRITSLTGQVVFTGTVPTGRSTELNLSHLNAGVYSVSISTDAAMSTSKLVITR